MVAGRSLSGSLMHLGHGGRARLSENVPNAMILIFAMMYASARCMELFIWILYASPRNWWGRWCGDSFATQLPTAQLEDKDEAVTGPLGPQRGKDRGDAVTHFSCSKRFCGLLAFQLQCISSCSNKIELLERFKCWLSKQDPSTLWIYAHWSPYNLQNAFMFEGWMRLSTGMPPVQMRMISPDSLRKVTFPKGK